MNHFEYLSELLSIQCEQAYGTLQRLKDTLGLSDADRQFLVKAQDVLIRLRDKFRVTKPDDREESNNGKHHWSGYDGRKAGQ